MSNDYWNYCANDPAIFPCLKGETVQSAFLTEDDHIVLVFQSGRAIKIRKQAYWPLNSEETEKELNKVRVRISQLQAAINNLSTAIPQPKNNGKQRKR